MRGYISEIALCLFHPHIPIAGIAQHFFDELSLRQRGLALFNVLPDIISRLSSTDVCSTDSFQQIISYLFAFVKNDRHCEILVKRLCRQFKQARLYSQIHTHRHIYIYIYILHSRIFYIHN